MKDIYILGFKYLDTPEEHYPMLHCGFFKSKKAVKAEVNRRNESESIFAKNDKINFRQGEWRFWTVYDRQKLDSTLKKP